VAIPVLLRLRPTLNHSKADRHSLLHKGNTYDLVPILCLPSQLTPPQQAYNPVRSM